MIAKPITLDIADPNKATPVPLIELFKASYLFGCFDSSSLNLIVIWIAKSTPTPNDIAPIVAVT